VFLVGDSSVVGALRSKESFELVIHLGTGQEEKLGSGDYEQEGIEDAGEMINR
jgi:hypothetical protein